MNDLIGKIGDNAVIFLAAILTICGIALFLMPWQVVFEGPPRQAAIQRPAEKGIVFVDMGDAQKKQPDPAQEPRPK